MISCITAEQAAALIRDGEMLVVGGNGGTGVAEAVLAAIKARFLARLAPQNLTLFNVTGVGAVMKKGCVTSRIRR